MLHSCSCTRKLVPEDFDTLNQFLVRSSDSSMFLRSNIQRGGFIRDPDIEFSADYFGYFIDNELHGVISLCWHGAILCQVPNLNLIISFFQDVRKLSPEFTFQTILGNPDQVQCLFSFLEAEYPIIKSLVSKDSTQKLYALDLEALIVPDHLVKGIVSCRYAQIEDLPILVPWRIAYDQELFYVIEDKRQITKETTHFIKSKIVFVLESQDQEIVARSDFNAMLPDVVQIGGVWTPPEFRNQGYARSVVAGSLIEARRQGIARAILFTDNPVAIRCYESLGFSEIGRYYILNFKEGIPFLPNSGGLWGT